MNEYQATIERCKVAGTDKQYQEWVRSQSSILGGLNSIYAHVRRAWNSGIGMKPIFSGIPLTNEQHLIQHQKGELALLQSCGYLLDMSGREAVNEAKRMIDEWAEWYRLEWLYELNANQG